MTAKNDPEAFKKQLIKRIGLKIRAARAEDRLSQEDLADAAGVGRSAVQRLEQGLSCPDLIDFVKICKAVGADWAELYRAAEAKTGQLLQQGATAP